MKEMGQFRGIIKHRETEQYYAGKGSWTNERELAKGFYTLAELMDEAIRHNIRDCCEFIITYAEKPEMKVYLPI